MIENKVQKYCFLCIYASKNIFYIEKYIQKIDLYLHN